MRGSKTICIAVLLRSEARWRVVKWVYMAIKGGGTCDSKEMHVTVLMYRSEVRCMQQ